VALEPREVLELMGSAPERYESVRAALRYRGDGPTIKAVRERFLRSEAGRRQHRPDLGIVPIVHRHEALPWRKPFERLPLVLDSLVIYCHYLVLGTYAPPAERSNRTKRGN
jgi:hypothetical protein